MTDATTLTAGQHVRSLTLPDVVLTVATTPDPDDLAVWVTWTDDGGQHTGTVWRHHLTADEG